MHLLRMAMWQLSSDTMPSRTTWSIRPLGIGPHTCCPAPPDCTQMGSAPVAHIKRSEPAAPVASPPAAAHAAKKCVKFCGLLACWLCRLHISVVMRSLFKAVWYKYKHTSLRLASLASMPQLPCMMYLMAQQFKLLPSWGSLTGMCCGCWHNLLTCVSMAV